MQIQIEKFLCDHIEGYLFHDLKTMAKAGPENPEDPGSLNYPMVATIVSGMELLGGLLSKVPFDKYNGENYFCIYWNEYLSKACPKYGIQNLDKLFYKLVRHGIAHVFIAKQGIWITKDFPEEHLKLDSYKIIVDATQFSDDFQRSYFGFVKPIVVPAPIGTTGVQRITKFDMQARLEEMIEQYGDDSKRMFSEISPNSYSPVSRLLAASLGVTGPSFGNNSVPTQPDPKLGKTKN